jgi:hypothetical protein
MHRVFFPVETFRTNPRTTSYKARTLYRKGLANFSPEKIAFTTKAHFDYYFRYGSKQTWEEMSTSKRNRLIFRFIQQVNPRGELPMKVLATQFMLYSVFMELKSAAISQRQQAAPITSTQFVEGADKAIQYLSMAHIYQKIAHELRRGAINPKTGEWC